VQERYEEIRRLGGEVLVVSFARPDHLALYVAAGPLPFPVVADPTRQAYQAFGLERTSWSAMLAARSVLRYLGLILRGWLPRRPQEGEDVLQLGGDFVLDATGRVVYVHRSAEPTDRPPARELIDAVRQAAIEKDS
jgi:hypothetical protein